MVRQLELADKDQAARIHRASFDHASPGLTGLHTADEGRWFYRERMFKACTLWGAFHGDALTGIIAFRKTGSTCSMCCRTRRGEALAANCCRSRTVPSIGLQLWTFQRNTRARRFYEARGFVLVEETDDAGNEENEPDARYLWTRG
jgi:hypothetical protein